MLIKSVCLTAASLALSVSTLVSAMPQRYNVPVRPGYSKAPRRVVVGYWSDWTASEMQPSQIPYKQLTHINYAFAPLTESLNLELNSTSKLNEVVRNAKLSGVKVLLSIGGWTGSRWFSTMAKNENTRKRFIDQCIGMIDTHKLDGVDIDWEFPGKAGMTCNVVDKPNDTNNFYLLLSEMRARLDQRYRQAKKELTLAVQIMTFEGPNGPLTDVQRFAPLLDRINVMTYDINGGWSDTTGPNAPLNFAPGKGAAFSVKSSVTAWKDAGIPPSKLTLGIGFYGRSVVAAEDMSSGLNQYVPRNKAAGVPRGDPTDKLSSDPCPGEPTVFSGVWQWKHIANKLLTREQTKAVAPWKRSWDETTQTPWLYNTQTKQFISYDDTKSVAIKAKYARCSGLGGVMVWSLSQDNGQLINAVQEVQSSVGC